MLVIHICESHCNPLTVRYQDVMQRKHFTLIEHVCKRGLCVEFYLAVILSNHIAFLIV